MIAKAGSRALTIEQIDAALYPMAGSLDEQVDKEMTTFTAMIHRDQWVPFLGTVLPQLLEPGFRDNRLQAPEGRADECPRPGSSFR